MPLLPEEPPDIPPCMPPGIPGVLMGMFKPVPPGISIVPKGGRVDSSKIETSPPIGMPPAEMEGRPLRL